MEDLREQVIKLGERVTSLETRTAVNERDIHSIMTKLDKMDNNITWVLRLVIGVVIGATLKLIGLV